MSGTLFRISQAEDFKGKFSICMQAIGGRDDTAEAYVLHKAHKIRCKMNIRKRMKELSKK